MYSVTYGPQNRTPINTLNDHNTTHVQPLSAGIIASQGTHLVEEVLFSKCYSKSTVKKVMIKQYSFCRILRVLATTSLRGSYCISWNYYSFLEGILLCWGLYHIQNVVTFCMHQDL